MSRSPPLLLLLLLACSAPTTPAATTTTPAPPTATATTSTTTTTTTPAPTASTTPTQALPGALQSLLLTERKTSWPPSRAFVAWLEGYAARCSQLAHDVDGMPVHTATCPRAEFLGCEPGELVATVLSSTTLLPDGRTRLSFARKDHPGAVFEILDVVDEDGWKLDGFSCGARADIQLLCDAREGPALQEVLSVPAAERRQRLIDIARANGIDRCAWADAWRD